MNPALVAAALNQWGLIGNLQQNNQEQGFNNSQGPNNQPNGSQQGGFLSWMSQGQQGGDNGQQASNSLYF